MKTGTHSEKLSGIPARAARRAFTLIELLVVIAISAILITLIFKPLLDAYNLTSRAGTQIESQAEARKVLSYVTAAVGNAVFVYDNALDETRVSVWVPGRNVPQVEVKMRYAMVEYVSPGRTSDQKPPAGTPLDPTTGEPVYTDGGPGSGFALPLAPGRVLGRIFPGLRNNASNTGQPNVPYGNNYEEPGRINASATNRYLLYDARVLAYIPDPAAPGQYIPNLRLFHTGQNGNGQVDRKDGPLRLHDPNFFYDSALAGGGETSAGDPNVWKEPGWVDLNGDDQVQICENWRAVSNPLLPVAKADVIAFDRNPERRNALRYFTLDADNNETNTPCNGDGSPCGTRPLITFEPTLIANDSGVATNTDSVGGESGAVVASAFKAQYGYWSGTARVLIYRRRGVDDDNPTGASGPYSNVNVFVWTNYGPDGNTTKMVPLDQNSGANLPDIINDPDPRYADQGMNLGFIDPFYDRNPKTSFGFDVDRRRGVVNFAIPSYVTAAGYLHDAEAGAQRYTPAEINLNLTRIVNGLEIGKRSLDLRFVDTNTVWPKPGVGDAHVNPMVPRDSPYNARGNTYSLLEQYLVRPNLISADRDQPMRIVPGSERVYGPDQSPGPNYGHRILYTRVSATAGVIGKNEYKINYEDVPNAIGAGNINDPRVRCGFVEFDSTYDTSSLPNMPDTAPGYAPVAGIAFIPGADIGVAENPLLGRFRPHGLPHYKVLNGALAPADAVEVCYSAQMNRPGDVVKMEYRTRELLTVNVGVRLYDPRTSTAQNMAVSGKIKVRNLQP